MCVACSGGVPVCLATGGCSLGVVYHVKTIAMMVAPLLAGIVASVKVDPRLWIKKR